MPFTPFHMGPGLAMKAVGGRHFSLMVFGFSQVVMDLEPLVRIYRGDAVLHGLTHTYLGASMIALVSVMTGRPICEWLLRRFVPAPSWRFLAWLWGDAHITWPAAFIGAFAGTYSHVFLDSVMHADMRPLLPLSDANALLFRIPVDVLHVACVGAGVAGVLLMGILYALRGQAGGKSSAS